MVYSLIVLGYISYRLRATVEAEREAKQDALTR